MSSQANPLTKRGWRPTRAGRWIDPVTRRSLTASEAWEVIFARESEEAISASAEPLESHS